jgi:hypothetical protein
MYDQLERHGWSRTNVFVRFGRLWVRGRYSVVADYRGFLRRLSTDDRPRVRSVTFTGVPAVAPDATLDATTTRG